MHRTLVACAVAITAAVMSPSAALAWAPASTATVHPGVQTFTEGAQCTANFIFRDGADTFIGQAAHCSGPAAPRRPTAASPSRCPTARRSR